MGITSSSKDDLSSGVAATVAEAAEKNRLVFMGSGGGYRFDLEDLLRASAEVLGKGSVGTSYKAVLEEGTIVVVKRLKDVAVSRREFEEHVRTLGQLERMDNLLPLRAYYYSKNEKLIVLDYLPVGSLSSLLHGRRGWGRTPLGWESRMRIALAAGRGISHLHTSARIVHGNIKASNVLLRSDLHSVVVSDFGLHPLFGSATPPYSGVGYRAPEVLETRRPTFKSDVYSFGVLLLELLSGKAPGEEGIDLPRWVQSVVREEWTAEVFDVELMRYPTTEEEMVQLLQIAMSCVATMPDARPDFPEVVRMMEDIANRTATTTFFVVYQTGKKGSEKEEKRKKCEVLEMDRPSTAGLFPNRCPSRMWCRGLDYDKTNCREALDLWGICEGVGWLGRCGLVATSSSRGASIGHVLADGGQGMRLRHDWIDGVRGMQLGHNWTDGGRGMRQGHNWIMVSKGRNLGTTRPMVAEGYDSSTIGMIVSEGRNLNTTGLIVVEGCDSGTIGLMVSEGRNLGTTGSMVAEGCDSSTIGLMVSEGRNLGTTGLMEAEGCDSGTIGLMVSEGSNLGTTGPMVAEGCDLGMIGLMVAEGCSSGTTRLMVAEGCNSGTIGLMVAEGCSSGMTRLMVAEGCNSGTIGLMVAKGYNSGMTRLMVAEGYNSGMIGLMVSKGRNSGTIGLMVAEGCDLGMIGLMVPELLDVMVVFTMETIIYALVPFLGTCLDAIWGRQ
ncbi:hypothetical protein BHE74_00037938 [Ensete ventricosum]|nr:hypothetical protein BHE74_00037938 [Ensete ventricosum]